MGYYRGGDNCYGRGDYYRGDYYRGDGILSFLGKAVKTISSVIPGPIGTIARAITGAPRGSVTAGPGPGVAGLPVVSIAPSLPQQERYIPQLPFGPDPTRGTPPGTAVAMLPGRGLCIIDSRTGKRLGKMNKSTYVTRGGGTSRWPKQLMVHPAGTECVRSRRMNVANPRALRRAIRRAQGFSKLARRVLTFVSAKAPKGRAKFKRK